MWIDHVRPQDAEDRLAEVYQQQARHLGRPTDITMAGSLYPELVDIRMQFYDVVESCPSSLPPPHRQGVALAAACVTGSAMITTGVRQKFLSAGGTDEQADALIGGTCTALPPPAATLAEYARTVAADPTSATLEHIDRCRASGATDLDVLDANNLAGYYSYLARVCLGLGIGETNDE